ncbi:S8/S53 family peptidase [Sphaerisporangium sp. B11E5]|uniref:S8 family peptidase n=1 Tax=Sphaerisporangium sp. B11E5 TaxID=3153563 RepID=UPI00325F2FDB
MTHPAAEDLSDARFWAQLNSIREAFGEDGVGVAVDRSGGPSFLYEPGHLLTRRDDLRRVQEALGEIYESDGVSRRERVIEVVPPEEDDEAEERSDVVRVRVQGDVLYLLKRLDAMLGVGVATPNHIFSIAPVAACPSGEPQVVCGCPDPLPEWNCDRRAGDGVSVLIIDTGLVDHYAREHPWLKGGPDPWLAIDAPQPGIQDYEGHGTFIAGVLRCVAPQVAFGMSNALNRAGAIKEHRLGPRLLKGARGWASAHNGGWPDIINVSAGATTRYSLPPKGLGRFIIEVEKHPNTVVVAAAGNNGSTNLFWPAAYAADYPQVISVGALRRYAVGRQERACFSNYGDWVTVFAPGEWLVNAFAWGEYQYNEPHSDQCLYLRPPVPSYAGCTCVDAPPQYSSITFDGMARWSGTCFATPIVAGLIAGVMSRTPGMSSLKAAGELLAKAAAPGWRTATGDPVLLPPGWPAAGSP